VLSLFLSRSTVESILEVVADLMLISLGNVKVPSFFKTSTGSGIIEILRQVPVQKPQYLKRQILRNYDNGLAVISIY
jgi:hypothetical protein